jgi:hypothetical protein
MLGLPVFGNGYSYGPTNEGSFMTDKKDAKKTEAPADPTPTPQHEDDYSAGKAEGERQDNAPDYKPTP